MLRALADDFGRLDGVDVVTLRDHRLGHIPLPVRCAVEVRSEEKERATFSSRAAAADWTVVIAPEIDGVLASRCRQVQQAGGRLLGPGPDFVALTADKHRTAHHLTAAGVPVPTSLALSADMMLPDSFPYPAVLKPRDGAGSIGVRLVSGPSDAPEPGELNCSMCLERNCPGTPASVAFLLGPGATVAMSPCLQRLSDDGRFEYLGGVVPLAESLARRATRLATAAVRALPPACGYLGVDLVLGDDPGGREDVVIEVNPRLTTSYVGLRAAARTNLAAAMLQVAQGRTIKLSFRTERIEFDADGSIRDRDGPRRRPR